MEHFILTNDIQSGGRTLPLQCNAFVNFYSLSLSPKILKSELSTKKDMVKFLDASNMPWNIVYCTKVERSLFDSILGCKEKKACP